MAFFLDRDRMKMIIDATSYRNDSRIVLPKLPQRTHNFDYIECSLPRLRYTARNSCMKLGYKIDELL